MSEIVQLDLLGASPERETQDVPLSTILKQSDLLAAVNLCLNVSGKHDQVFSLVTGIDPGNFSAMRKGTKHFPLRSLDSLCNEAGNDIPLIYWAHKRGYGLVRLRDAKDRRIAELEAKNSELQKEIETLAKYGVIQRAK